MEIGRWWVVSMESFPAWGAFDDFIRMGSAQWWMASGTLHRLSRMFCLWQNGWMGRAKRGGSLAWPLPMPKIAADNSLRHHDNGPVFWAVGSTLLVGNGGRSGPHIPIKPFSAVYLVGFADSRVK